VRLVKDTSTWTEPRTLGNLALFIKKECDTPKSALTAPVGAPHSIVVTASGIRAADVFRELKSSLPKQGFKKPNVAKLFAKHIKLAEQVEHLKKHK
jgi:protein CMS1